MNLMELIINREAIETECIISYGYNEELQILDIEFSSGYYLYRYLNVPQDELSMVVFNQLNGLYFNKVFRNKYHFIRLPLHSNNHKKNCKETDLSLF